MKAQYVKIVLVDKIVSAKIVWVEVGPEDARQNKIVFPKDTRKFRYYTNTAQVKIDGGLSVQVVLIDKSVQL